MNDQSRNIQRVYLGLLLLHTLAASLIWGINTLFLLDAGLSNGQAFAANAGDPNAYGIAGLAAAVVGGAQIGGGILVPHPGARSVCGPRCCSSPWC